MFREVGYGVWFFVCAVLGMVTAGFICSGALLVLDPREPIIRELAWAFGTISSVIGAIIGGAIWLGYKNSLPKKHPG
jgi:hypothetical protein